MEQGEKENERLLEMCQKFQEEIKEKEDAMLKLEEGGKNRGGDGLEEKLRLAEEECQELRNKM